MAACKAFGKFFLEKYKGKYIISPFQIMLQQIRLKDPILMLDPYRCCDYNSMYFTLIMVMRSTANHTACAQTA
ncbi:hypothetical protein HOLleu_44559 [Holothuria leucospilota]|uniref:Uncharacterized protein n=1 Tax=Holothuria leucospilota TaxID=206669 RepID=A0A9Q0Y9J4_HOLLE|nr:hypothetical protein HOLleu_44559 [Holothuria leucospilota]